VAKLCIVLDVPGWSGEQLRQAIHDIDATEDTVPIATKNVDVKDILMYMFDGQLGVTHTILYQGIQDDDEPRKPWGEVYPPQLPKGS